MSTTWRYFSATRRSSSNCASDTSAFRLASKLESTPPTDELEPALPLAPPVDEDDCFTIMFYLNKIWDMSYAGETIYTDPTRSEIIKSIIPKPGRVAVFNGFIPHCAREVSRTCVELRMVATFKYRRDTVANHWKEKHRRENES